MRFSFYGHMLCFLNCHLAAHMNYALQRMDEFEYILDMQDFDMYNTPNVLDHKSVLIWIKVAHVHAYENTTWFSYCCCFFSQGGLLVW